MKTRLTFALSKGRLFDDSLELLRIAGFPIAGDAGRRLVVETGELRFLLVKDRDVPTYVEHGVADAGIVGRDVLLESRSDVHQPLDLGFGRCRLVVAAASRELVDAGEHASLRVATKYPRVALTHFLSRGVSAEIVSLSGSVELAASLGLAHAIVDVVETGRTLKENGLVVVDEIAECSARLIVNRAAAKSHRVAIDELVEALAREVAA